MPLPGPALIYRKTAALGATRPGSLGAAPAHHER